MEEARKLLVETKVKALGAVSGSTIVQLLDTNTVEQALQVLAEHRILSAPVLAPGDDGQAQGVRWPAQLPNSDIMGFLCVNDILTSFLECYTAEFGESSLGPSSSSGGGGGGAPQNGHHRRASTSGGSGPGGASMLTRMRQLEALGTRFAQQQLRHLPYKGCDGDFLHSRHAGGATLLELVMYGFLDPKRRGMHEGEEQAKVVHRVALFDNSGRVTSIISQSDICRFLMSHLDRLGGLAEATVEELGWHQKKVLSCTPETPALEAMRLMVAEGVSCLAVVTSPTTAAGASPSGGAVGGGAGPGPGCPGRLLGNFSVSEMRAMTAEHFGALSLPVGEFLAMEHATEYVAVNRERLLEEGVIGSPAHSFIQNRLRRTRPHAPGEEVGQRLIVATPRSTFAEVIGLLVRHCIHRVYVVDEREVPVGIVTCTDILRKVVEVATEPLSPSPSRSLSTPLHAADGAADLTATA